MSLLDDVSIVVTPNGYKAERLYAVIPTNALGSEKITGFTNGTTYPFDTFTTSGNNITSAIVSSAFAGAVSNSISVTSGEIYKVTFDYTKNSGDDLRVVFSSSVNGAGTQISNNELISASGTYTKYFTITSTTTGYLQMGTGSGSDSLNASISNVSVKKDTGADMDVTRATAATRVDENGLVNYAQVVTGSDIVTNGDFSNGTTDWTLQNGWSLGSNDVEFNTSVSQYRKLYQENFLNIGSHYKLTFEIKSISSGSISNFGYSGSFDTIGVKTQIFTAIYDDLYLEPTGDAVLTIDNIKVEEVTRNNVPRIDYTGGGCPHILSEPQRTNLITYSEDFSQSYWTKTGTTVESGFVSPNGTENSYKLKEDTSTGLHLVKPPNSSFASNIYTLSVFAKYNGRVLQIASTSTGGHYANFDLLNGVIGNIGGSTANVTMTEISNGWYRCSMTTTSNMNTAIINTVQSATSVYQESYTGDGTSGIYIFGAQVENGSYPTSYIPTSGSTVTRNQDQFTRDGIASLINSTEGVLFAEMAALDNDLTTRMISLSDGGNSNRIHMFYHSVSNEIAVNYRVSGTTESSIAFVVSNITNFNKIAFKWKSADFSLWINGVEVGTDSNTTMLPADTLNTLAFEQGNGGNNLYAKVKQLQVYDTALTDNQLIQLTGEAGTHFFESYSEMAETLTYTIQ